MIPRKWAAIVEASDGRLLVKRDEVEDIHTSVLTSQGGKVDLYRSETSKMHTRKCSATVVSISPGCLVDRERIKVGTRIIVSPSSGRRLVFGYLKGREVELWSIGPEAIQATLLTSEPLWVDRPMGNALEWIAKRDNLEQDDRFDEGDSRGLR